MTKDDKIEERHVQIQSSDVPFWCSSRLGLAISGFVGFILVYALRVNLSVAIVCMVNHTAIASTDNGSDVIDTECAKVNDNSNDTEATDLNPLGGSLVWDETLQGTILGSFFWGYLVAQVPAGWLAMRFGGKRVFGISMVMASIATLFTPVLANASSSIGIIILRIFLGIVTGVSFPSMHSMWGHWAPPMERSKLITFTYAGAQVGIVITFPLSGFLCKYGFAGGWPSIFYIIGALSLAWSVGWLLLVSDSPAQHSRISSIERDYILSSLGEVATEKKVKTKIPWWSILTSLPVYAIIVANITSDWGAYTLLTKLPTYINSVLKFDITSNGLVSALPYIAFWLVINAGGWLADFIREKNLLTTSVTRKVFTSFGQLIPAVMLIALGYVDCSKPAVAIGLLVFAVSLTGLQYSGFLVNHVDIAPELAGILFGLSNSIASVTGFVSPLIVGVITDKDPTRTGWQIVFYVAAGIYIFGAIFYALFASGDLQPWAQTEEDSNEENEKYNLTNGGAEEAKMLHETDQV